MRELHMNRANRILPTYTGDVSGACSALFELGGMVVIHDPSGCNSTYNTHDETRWYDHDSLIYISAFVERDAILGRDDKLIHDVVDAANELQPRFIALCNSPVPFISGTDFHAICKLIEAACDIPCFYVRTNGMHDYVVGAGNAFVRIAERFVRPAPVRPGTINIMGATPLDLGIAGSDATLRSFASDAGFEVISCWAMGSTLEELSRAAEAEVNLVVSSTGLPVAQFLLEHFGTPYVVGTPVGSFTTTLAEELQTATKVKSCRWPCRDARSPVAESNTGLWCAIGEPVTAGSIAAAIETEWSHPVQVINPLEGIRETLLPSDACVYGEEEAEAALSRAALVIGDEFYRCVLQESTRLAALPHQALSGRNGWKAARDLATLDLKTLLA